MSDPVIRVEHLTKAYRLGVINHGTLRHDLESWWARLCGKDDPHATLGSGHHSDGTGTFLALDDVSFDVHRGETLGIIGRNGAGKSTLLKILSRITDPTSGSLKLKGRVASLLEVGTGFHPELTGRENVFLNGAVLGMTKAEIARRFDEIVAFSGVEKFIDTPVKRYSSGMYVRLAFGVAAHLEPEILIVDEVLAVGDADFQKKCLGKMEEAGKGGRTVLFVSHNMGAIKNLCSKVLLIENGKLITSGSPDSVISSYLGDSTNLDENVCLELIEDRSGNGKAIFASFSVENKFGNRVTKVLTGDDIVFVFRVKVLSLYLNRLDLGFSLHNLFGENICVLYSSYQNKLYESKDNGYINIRCKIEKFPFACKRLIVKGRLVVNGEEADWPKSPLGYVDIEEGDFYGTGSLGFQENLRFLVKGEWA
jgi:lipopolysaccharide transport system ATP-binding protein